MTHGIIHFYRRYSPIRLLHFLALSGLCTFLEGMSLVIFLGAFQKGDPNSSQLLLSLWVVMALIGIKLLISRRAYSHRGKVLAEFWAKLRTSLIDQLKAKPWRKFQAIPLGEVQTVMTAETDRIAMGFKVLLQVTNRIWEAVILLTFCAYLDWKLCAIAAVFGFALFLWMFSKGKKIAELSKMVSSQILDLSQATYQWLKQQKYIRASDSVRWNQRLDQFIQKTAPLIAHRERWERELVSWVEPSGAVLVIGYLLVTVGYLEQPLIPVLGAALLLYRTSQRLALVPRELAELNQVSGSISAFLHFVDDSRTPSPSVPSYQVLSLDRGIELKSLALKSRDGWLLHASEVEFPARKSIGLIGPNGSGKTAILDVLAGLVSPDRGQVVWDEMDLNQLRQQGYRPEIGYLTQESDLFRDTIWNNLTLWADPDHIETRARVEWVAKELGLWRFVESLPQGLLTSVADSGTSVSGGQRVLIALAREFILDKPILLLDEPTHFLDADQREKFLLALPALSHGKTVIIATHDPDLVDYVDLVYAIRGNEVVLSSGGVAPHHAIDPVVMKADAHHKNRGDGDEPLLQ